MAKQKWMNRFARWHIWLGWLVGVPIVMWMASGLIMVARPIDEVRGNHLRVEAEEPPLAVDRIGPILTEPGLITSAQLSSQDGRPVWRVEYADGGIARFDAAGVRLPQVSEDQARAIVTEKIKGGERIASATFYPADKVPFDFRRPMPVWQVELEDGARIYIGRDTAEIEAVRTRWWRLFDFVWGLHIMDLETREDTSHPILILFAALGLIGSLLGTVLMFRRRKSRVKAPADAG